MQAPRPSTYLALAAIVLIAALAVLARINFFGGSGPEMRLDEEALNALRSTESRIKDNELENYKALANKGASAELCRQAGIVAAAYEMLKDSVNYRVWKDIARRDCQAAASDAGGKQLR